MKNEVKVRSAYIGLATSNCVQCQGAGERASGVICDCACRAIFKACLNRFRECAAGGHLRPILLDGTSASHGYRLRGRKHEEYQADFILVSRRTLDPVEYDILRFHFLMAGDWKICCRRLGIRDKGTFFHSVYRVQQKLGRAFLETAPFALYPLDEYFQSPAKGRAAVQPFPAHTAPRAYTPIRPALAPKRGTQDPVRPAP